MIGFGEQFDMIQDERLRPGERLMFRDEQHRQVIVYGRDRRTNWKTIALLWIAASILHVIGAHVL